MAQCQTATFDAESIKLMSCNATTSTKDMRMEPSLCLDDVSHVAACASSRHSYCILLPCPRLGGVMHADAGRMASDLSQRAVFRAASGLAVLSGGGRVWSSDGADYFQEAEVTNHVDVFVSHSWAADRWMKHLAMCYFLNFGLSVKVTLAAVLLSQGIFFIYPEQSISTLFVLVMDFPVLAFFLAFFFGQHLTCGRWCPSLWVDKLCIDQTDESAKQRGIASVPTTVSNSSELLVPWLLMFIQ